MDSGAGSQTGSMGLGGGNPSSHAFPSVDSKAFVYPSADAGDAFPTALPTAATPALAARAAVDPDHKSSAASSSVATSSAVSSAALAHTFASSALSAGCDQVLPFPLPVAACECALSISELILSCEQMDRKHVHTTGSGLSALDELY